MKSIKMLALGLILVAVLSLAVTAQKAAKTVDQEATENDSEKQPQGQTTFLQCVSYEAAVKNTCYKAASVKKTVCVEAAKAQEDARATTKACSADYKQEKKQCKTDFKKTKNECKKIKHSFLDSIRASFK
jgi:hypothetical protein